MSFAIDLRAKVVFWHVDSPSRNTRGTEDTQRGSRARDFGSSPRRFYGRVRTGAPNKYRPIARLVQHKEATIAISGAIQKGELDKQALKNKADFIRNKLADDDFEALTNEVNADYVEKFSEVVASIKLPDAEVLPGKVFPSFKINSVKVRFSPHLLLRRLDRTNRQRQGAFMLRYAKGKALSPTVGGYQSAAGVRKAVGIRGGAISGNIKVSFQAARSIG